MRNGNMSTTPEISILMIRFYLTYEEWKLALMKFSINCASLVFTLPMRNGNKLRLYNDNLMFRVFTLPMRNGNYVTYGNAVIAIVFLPYLWGMETLLCNSCSDKCYSFYLTYEEWKHWISAAKLVWCFCFYLTYEEWKPSSRSRRSSTVY